MLERLVEIGSLPLLVLALLAAGVGAPIPEDPVMIAAGVVAHRTSQAWWLVLPVVYVTAVVADCVLLGLARWFGEPLLGWRPFRWVATPDRRARVRELLDRYGGRAVFVGRLFPGPRAVVVILAGLERMPFRTFLSWDGLAALITVSVMFGLGYGLSSHLAAVEAGVARFEHWVAVVAVLGLLVAWLVWSWWRASRRGGDEG